jgi:hypothetical protein
VRRLGASALVIGAATALAVCGSALPASAHAVRVGVDPSNWRSTVTSVQPAVRDVGVSIGDGAQRLAVTVRGPHEVIVRGLADEPYLRITGNGVWINQRSTTTWEFAGPSASPPTDVSDRAAPRWRQVSSTGTWRWHDSRTHWPGFTLPPPVQRHPSRRQLVGLWQVPLTVDGNEGIISGRIDWIPGPSAAPGVTCLLLLLVGVVAAGVVRRWRPAAATALLTITVLDVVHAFGMVAGRVGGWWTRLGALPAHGALSLVLWAAAVTCAVAMVRRRHLTPAVYAAAMVAASIFLTEGVPSLALVWHSQAITGLPVAVDRYLVAALTGASFGLLVASILLIRRLDRRPVASRPVPTGAVPA